MTTAQQDSPAQEQAPKHVNRLSRESSPYLLQHQHNPVDWYPWGSEAFEAARTQDKPIFLSIGYSTCYWCHVMERESFESEQIAAIMNEHFICIKVDREERPDVDDIYMAAVQMTTGHGGWPMSVFLEPQSLKPFFAGTYFPPGDSFGRPGFPSILRQLARAWESQREAVMKQADQIAAAVTEHLSKLSEPASISKREVDQAISELLGSYDAKDGGFVSPGQRAPKFPTPVNLDFLMGAAWDVKQARDATIHTLDRMIMGGMYDQVGGGFHRYSVDEKWLVPHFEKMLYDNGQLASTYARAFELTKDAYYAEALRETLDYVLREMTSASGAFYSAQDAEVNGQEGANYIWTADEVRDALNAENLEAHVDLALEVYGLSQGTNFQDPHHPELQPKNVLFLIDRPNKIAARRGIAPNEFNAQLETINSALLKARMRREQPRLDDKILASWNGTMIAGFADGGRVLNEKKYKDAAIRAADFVLRTMRTSDGGLLRSFRGDSAAKIDGFLEDYAMMIRGLIAVHRATNDRRMLEEAKRLTQIARVKFWDQTSVGGASGGGGGGYFDTLEGQSDLFVRVKSSYDGAIPSGNSVMLHNLLDLHELTAQTTYLDDAAATLKALSGNISKHPTASILATLALHRMISKYPQRLGAAVTVAMPGTSSLPRSTQPVQISLEPVEVHVKPGSPATFTVKIVIAKPFHINSSNPGEDFLIPLSIKLAGCEGLKLTPEYPKGDAYKSEFADGTIYVHSGTIAVPVRLEQTGTFTGTPRLSITYQTCTDKECLEPKTEMLGLRIIAQR